MADYRIRITVDPSGAASGSRAATREVGAIGDAADRANARVSGLMGGLGGLGGALKVGLIVAAVTKYAQVTDAIKQANAQLKLATNTQDQLNAAQAKAYQIAQRNGTAYGATATLLSKNLKAANSLGIAGARAQMMAGAATAAVAAGIRVSGTSAEEAKGSLLQLGQALSSGALRGDELNSVMEGMPAVAEAIAKAMGKTTGQLRAMGAAGKLTSQEVFKALVAAQPRLEKLASMIPLTFSAALEKVKNAGAQALAGFDQGTALGSGLIGSLDLISKALDAIAVNAGTVSNVVVGLLVAAAVKSAVSFRVASVAASNLAKENLAVAASANAVAIAQARQAASSLSVARASRGFGGVKAASAAAGVVDAGKKVAETTAALRAAEAASAAASARAGLFGTILVRAATIGRVALAAIGGPIGLAVAGLIALALYAGKAAMSFKPIEGSAAELQDYIGAAFDAMGAKITSTIEDARKWWTDNSDEMYAAVRRFAVRAIDAYISIATPAYAVAAGIAGAFAAAASNTGAVLEGLAADAKAAFTGQGVGLGNTRAAIAGATSIGDAYSKAAAGARASVKSITGESVIASAEGGLKRIRKGISDAFNNSGLRKAAEERAKLRAEAAKGGLGEVGKPPVAEAKKDKDKKKAKEQTFADILVDAQEEARLAGLTTAERARQEVIQQAQKTLQRGLTAGEEAQLRAAVLLKQTNEANLAVTEATRDAIESAGKARMQAAADAARDAKDFGGAVAIEAEIAVQEMLNRAKRDGLTLDASKVAAYRQAVTLAGQETEVIRQQQEARRALQEIADQARKSIRSAISDGIFDALSGKLSFSKVIKSFGDVLKRQFAEQVTYSIFEGASANQSTVTGRAVSIVQPAAQALAVATNTVTAAMGGAPAEITTAASQFTGALSGAVGPLSEALSGLLGLFGLAGKGSLIGGGNGSSPQTGIGKFLGAGGPVSRGLEKIASGLGIGSRTDKNGVVTSAGSRLVSKVGTGAMIGGMTAGLPGMFGLKTSSTGGTLGGMAGSLIGGPLGAAIGGALGSTLGGLFKKTKQASSTITVVNGVATAGAAVGSGSAAKKAADALGGSVADQLNAMAKTLGAGLGNAGVSIGYRPGHKEGAYRVDTTGQGKLTGVQAFEDQADAIEYAVKIAIQKGVFTGLSAGVSDALKTGRATVEEAASFMSAQKDISRQAKGLTDPVGAAIDELDDKFNAIRDQYKLFGADMTDLEKVYQSERAKVVQQAVSQSLDSLKSLRDELVGGDLGNVSRVDQVSAQDKAFAAIEAARASGGAVDYEEVNKVGRALLDAQQQLDGNSVGYQAQVSRVMKLIDSLIGEQGVSNVVALPQQDSAPIIAAAQDTTLAVNEQTTAVVTAINNLGAATVRQTAELSSRLDALSGGDYGSARGNEFRLQAF